MVNSPSTMCTAVPPLCRVCLRGAPEVRLVRDSSVRAFFTDVVRLLDVPSSVLLCVFCAVSVREALALYENAVHADPLLCWIQAAIRDGHTVDEALISNARSLQQVLHPLTLKNLGVAELNCSSEPVSEVVENLPEDVKVENDYAFSDIDGDTTKLLDYFHDSTFKMEEDEKENIEQNKQNVLDCSIEMCNESRSKQVKKGAINKEVKRKKGNKGNSEEAQFEVIYLSYEQQLQELGDKRRSEKYLKSKFQCEACGLGFIVENVYKSHMQRHAEHFGPHKCDICKLRFATSEVLLQHALAHRRHYRCVRCAAVVRRRCHCGAHRERCDGEAVRAECEYCSKMFRDKFSLKQHVRDMHLREKVYECNYCSKKFTHKQKLSVHIRCHTGEKPYECETCNKKFSTNSNLKAHLAVHEDTEPRHYCVECDVYLKTAKGLKRHFEKSVVHQDKDSLRYACPHCPLRFLNEKRLAAHINYIHLGQSPYSCDICARRFSSSGNLRKHIRSIHQKVKANKDQICDICGRAFALKRTLESHRNTHTGLRPYPCDHCKAEFAQRSSLYTHIRAVHFNIRKKR